MPHMHEHAWPSQVIIIIYIVTEIAVIVVEVPLNKQALPHLLEEYLILLYFNLHLLG